MCWIPHHQTRSRTTRHTLAADFAPTVPAKPRLPPRRPAYACALPHACAPFPEDPASQKLVSRATPSVSRATRLLLATAQPCYGGRGSQCLPAHGQRAGGERPGERPWTPRGRTRPPRAEPRGREPASERLGARSREPSAPCAVWKQAWGVERGRGHSRPSPRGVTGRGLHPTRPARVRAQRGPAPATLRPSGAGWKGGDLLDLMQRWWRLPRPGAGSVGRKGTLPSSPQLVQRTVCYFCV